MGIRNAKGIICKIAKKEGIEESKVREEIERAILIGYMNFETRQEWDKIFGAGRVPSPEEFIMKVSNLVVK